MTGTFDASFVCIDRDDHTAANYSRCRNHQSQPILVDCIAHYHHLDNQWHCKVTDMFVWITVLLATANTATSVEFLLNFERHMLLSMGVPPNKSATVCVVRLLS